MWWRLPAAAAVTGLMACSTQAAGPAAPSGPVAIEMPGHVGSGDMAVCLEPPAGAVSAPVGPGCANAAPVEVGASPAQFTDDDGTTRWIWITFVPTVIVLAALLLF